MRGLVDHVALAGLVHGGRGAEDEALHAVAGEFAQQDDGLANVVVVVVQWLGHRFGNHDLGGAVDHVFNLGVIGEDAIQHGSIGDIAFVVIVLGGKSPQALLKSSRMIGVIPLSTQQLAMVEPINPAPPVIKTFMFLLGVATG